MIPNDGLLRRSANRPIQQVLDILLSYLVGRKPNGVAGVQGFLQFIHRRLSKGSIKLEQEPHSLMLVAFYIWLQDLLPALGAMDIARMK